MVELYWSALYSDVFFDILATPFTSMRGVNIRNRIITFLTILTNLRNDSLKKIEFMAELVQAIPNKVKN